MLLGIVEDNLYAVSGETDAAIDCLEEALHAGFGRLDWIRKDPDLDALRGESRFEALIADAASKAAPARD